MIAPPRITQNPDVMGGKPCIRGLRVTVDTVVGLVASGHSEEKILQLYPYLEVDDIREALAFAEGGRCAAPSGLPPDAGAAPEG